MPINEINTRKRITRGLVWSIGILIAFTILFTLPPKFAHALSQPVPVREWSPNPFQK